MLYWETGLGRTVKTSGTTWGTKQQPQKQRILSHQIHTVLLLTPTACSKYARINNLLLILAITIQLPSIKADKKKIGVLQGLNSKQVKYLTSTQSNVILDLAHLCAFEPLEGMLIKNFCTSLKNSIFSEAL